MRRSLKLTIPLILAVGLILAGLIFVDHTSKTAASEEDAVRLRLADDRELHSGDSETFDHMELYLGWQIDPPGYISTLNHSEELWRKDVRLPAGPAKLIKMRQGGSAALPAPDTTVYWLCMQRPAIDPEEGMNTYYLEARVTGDEQTAEDELLQLGQNWVVPQSK
ncbi:hypothetical protein [Paenibacillus sp. NFR01]|uniref:hypothetical protein n=1 Tax=Paenibacillus sp. NFR01 TaxID=1566279 RepID=UPI0008CBD4BF|nr:hypothetical protein [Paenibacillus sp. NFR01]SET13828.1 hypothetical protein SAMN03159358_0822 [Paenibacillus sp. NFR01]